MRVVIVGCGRVGCGYLTPLFRSVGCRVTLAARTEEAAERIRRSGGFRVRITRQSRVIEVEESNAVAVGTPGFAEAVADADLVCVSVGVTNVRSLAEPLARALAGRRTAGALDVWVIENGDCAGELERGVRRTALAARLALPPLGFAGAIATVAVARGSWREEARPEFVGDDIRDLWIDEARLLTGIPALQGVRGTTDYLARLREKLYVFNAGHAICAYLGWLRGHATIAEAAADPLLRPILAGCLLESRRALLSAYPSLGSDLDGPVAEALERFRDRELADPIPRVAREPIRKLGREDRLVGPTTMICRATGRVPPYFALAVAGALLYRCDDDEQSLWLRAELARDGVMAVIQRVCGLVPADPFAQAIAARYRNFIITPTETLFPPVHLVDAAGTDTMDLTALAGAGA
jgi:mannitol-1-phosphate 5-dehydrogenase